MIVIEHCAVATVDGAGTEYTDGHIVVEGTRIVAVGPGPYGGSPGATRFDGTGCLATPAWSTPTTTSTSGPPAATPSRRSCSAG